uniref:Uncharacterized protein n=1 Tax=Salix viminalis TaxID=40686 RepID=A0A6N2MJ78_SALVM
MKTRSSHWPLIRSNSCKKPKPNLKTHQRKLSQIENQTKTKLKFFDSFLSQKVILFWFLKIGTLKIFGGCYPG